MILVDTSVWVDHFRSRNPALSSLLSDGQVFGHPFVIGELACGNIRSRAVTLAELSHLPEAITAHHGEVMRLIEQRRLWGVGIGWVDAHLIASARLLECSLWTLDLALAEAATKAGVRLFPGQRRSWLR